MKNTKIEYVDHSWSPWYGCTKLSPGCLHCFAERWAKRSGMVKFGNGEPRRLASDAKWREPLRWDAAGGRVLVDLCDPFDTAVDLWWTAQFIDLIRSTPHLRWLLLTKRPENVMEIMTPRRYLNVRIGASIEDQPRFEQRMDAMSRIDADGKWISFEPLLGPIYFGYRSEDVRVRRHIRWAVIGGESGPGARPCDAGWVRHLVRQLKDLGIPVFVKQLGSNPHSGGMPVAKYKHPKGGDPAEWPEDLRVREFAE